MGNRFMTWVRTVLFDGTVHQQAILITLIAILFLLYRNWHHDFGRMNYTYHRLYAYVIVAAGIPIYLCAHGFLNRYYRDKDIRRIFGEDESK